MLKKAKMMKRVFAALAAVAVAVSMALGPVMRPVMAKDGGGAAGSGGGSGGGDNCVQTAILGGGEVCDNGDGSSIIHILNLVVDILTMGIGILGVIGITVVGIQYLTAGGSEEKTRKAKTRMLEIVIGLIVYALIYALIKWLMPSVQ